MYSLYSHGGDHGDEAFVVVHVVVVVVVITDVVDEVVSAQMSRPQLPSSIVQFVLLLCLSFHFFYFSLSFCTTLCLPV